MTIVVENRKVILLTVGEWYTAPPEALKMVQALDEEYGGDIAIGQHPELGWVVLHDQGYGVAIVWRETR